MGRGRRTRGVGGAWPSATARRSPKCRPPRRPHPRRRVAPRRFIQAIERPKRPLTVKGFIAPLPNRSYSWCFVKRPDIVARPARRKRPHAPHPPGRRRRQPPWLPGRAAPRARRGYEVTACADGEEAARRSCMRNGTCCSPTSSCPAWMASRWPARPRPLHPDLRIMFITGFAAVALAAGSQAPARRQGALQAPSTCARSSPRWSG